MRSPARPSGTRASFLIASILAVLSPLVLVAWVGGSSAQPRNYTTALRESRRAVLGRHAVAKLNANSALTVEATAGCDIALKSAETQICLVGIRSGTR